MPTIEIRDTIEAPSDKVFAIFADLEHASENIESILGMEILTEGAIGEGTRWRETRKMMGKECTEEMWISDWRPGSGYTVDCESCGCSYVTDISITPSGGGTEVVMSMKVKPMTFMAKLMSPLTLLFAGTFKKCMMKDIDDLRQKLAADS
jgi:hypothetical protein